MNFSIETEFISRKCIIYITIIVKRLDRNECRSLCFQSPSLITHYQKITDVSVVYAFICMKNNRNLISSDIISVTLDLSDKEQ